MQRLRKAAAETTLGMSNMPAPHRALAPSAYRSPRKNGTRLEGCSTRFEMRNCFQTKTTKIMLRDHNGGVVSPFATHGPEGLPELPAYDFELFSH
jgi:hypothetical protein